jgi:prolyl-tRNA synthetase
VIVRPTSETIIGDAFARWVRSYRDLPLLINQWCNIVRWEMRTRMFLQAGTSHFLGQNFAKASEIRFLDQSGEQQHAWTTSWGSSTRLIGAILMTHSDDDGFVAPPKVAPLHVAILPIFRSDEDKPRVLEYCHNVARELRAQRYADRQVTVLVDERDERGGDKVWHWIKKGVPLRLEIGARDMAKDALFVGRRDRAPKDKQSVPRGELVASVAATLQSIHDSLYARAKEFRRQHTRRIDSKEEFYAWFTPPRVEENVPTPIHGGFALTHFSGDVRLEERIKNELGVTVRCIPLDKSEPGTCPFSGEPSPQRVVWAKAY